MGLKTLLMHVLKKKLNGFFFHLHLMFISRHKKKFQKYQLKNLFHIMDKQNFGQKITFKKNLNLLIPSIV